MFSSGVLLGCGSLVFLVVAAKFAESSSSNAPQYLQIVAVRRFLFLQMGQNFPEGFKAFFLVKVLVPESSFSMKSYTKPLESSIKKQIKWVSILIGNSLKPHSSKNCPIDKSEFENNPAALGIAKFNNGGGEYFSRICKHRLSTFFQNLRPVYIVPIILDGIYKEFVMITIVKWLVTALLAGFAWLVGNYTVEYFRPYKRN